MEEKKLTQLVHISELDADEIDEYDPATHAVQIRDDVAPKLAPYLPTPCFFDQTKENSFVI